jgi:hypothetical protein
MSGDGPAFAGLALGVDEEDAALLLELLPTLKAAREQRNARLCRLLVGLREIQCRSGSSAVPNVIPDPAPVTLDPVDTEEFVRLSGTGHRNARDRIWALGGSKVHGRLVVERLVVEEYLARRVSA